MLGESPSLLNGSDQLFVYGGIYIYVHHSAKNSKSKPLLGTAGIKSCDSTFLIAKIIEFLPLLSLLLQMIFFLYSEPYVR